MEKTAIINELQRLSPLWSNIEQLSTQLKQTEDARKTILACRNDEAGKRYSYNPNIHIPNELPTYNAALVEADISRRHKADCLAAANKKLSRTRVALVIAMALGFAISLIPHVLNFLAGSMEKYNIFSSFGKLGDFFLQLTFVRFTDENGTLSDMGMVYTTLAAFTVFWQLLTIFLARLAAASRLKAKACIYVPELGRAYSGLWTGVTVVAGLFCAFTWFTVDPISALGLVPILLLTPLLKRSVSKLPSSANPIPTAEESVRLDNAKAEDARNHAANEAARKAANDRERKKFESRQNSALADYDKDLAKHDQSIAFLTERIASLKQETASSLIPQKDNNRDTVDRLLYYLATDRADTLKEALHLVDLDKQRELDRQMQYQIAQMKLQNDRMIADLDRDAAMRQANRMLDEQRAHNEQIRRAQEAHNRNVMRELDDLKNS